MSDDPKTRRPKPKVSRALEEFLSREYDAHGTVGAGFLTGRKDKFELRVPPSDPLVKGPAWEQGEELDPESRLLQLGLRVKGLDPERRLPGVSGGKQEDSENPKGNEGGEERENSPGAENDAEAPKGSSAAQKPKKGKGKAPGKGSPSAQGKAPNSPPQAPSGARGTSPAGSNKATAQASSGRGGEAAPASRGKGSAPGASAGRAEQRSAGASDVGGSSPGVSATGGGDATPGGGGAPPGAGGRAGTPGGGRAGTPGGGRAGTEARPQRASGQAPAPSPATSLPETDSASVDSPPLPNDAAQLARTLPPQDLRPLYTQPKGPSPVKVLDALTRQIVERQDGVACQALLQLSLLAHQCLEEDDPAAPPVLSLQQIVQHFSSETVRQQLHQGEWMPLLALRILASFPLSTITEPAWGTLVSLLFLGPENVRHALLASIFVGNGRIEEGFPRLLTHGPAFLASFPEAASSFLEIHQAFGAFHPETDSELSKLEQHLPQKPPSSSGKAQALLQKLADLKESLGELFREALTAPFQPES